MIYYNDIDSKCCAWLRELIAQGHLPHGVVDCRSISDIRPDELKTYTQCHFFAGIGGWPYALRLAGVPDDFRVWTGSCPCQPLSCAGKQRGHEDERHLWPAFARLIRECQPPVCFGEQVASSLGREWLAGVRIDLEAMGYAVGAADLCAAGVGAPHIRQRLYWVADSTRYGVWGSAESTEANGTRTENTGSGIACGLAFSEHPERREEHVAREDGCYRQDGGRQEAHGEPGTCGEIQRLDDPPADGREMRERIHTEHDREGFGEGRDDCRLGKSDRAGSQPGSQTAEAVGHGRSAEPAGFWFDSRWHQCLDGKWRRVPIEPAFFPLVNGVSGGRVVLLRGAGNAIVPQVAAEFVSAFYDCSNGEVANS